MAEYKMTFNRDFDNLVSELKTSNQNSATSNSDVIRRAVALYSYLHQQVSTKPGSKVAVISNNNEILLVVDPLP